MDAIRYQAKDSQTVVEPKFEVVQEKFRRGESVIALFEAYQIIGNETPNRLLALVTSTNTYAIFSFAVSRLPPETISDLTIDNIFPMNDDFRIQTDCKGGIAKLQFVIISTIGQSIFYYYPYSASLNDFNAFYNKVQSAILDYKQQINLRTTTTTTSTPTTTTTANSDNIQIGFAWLNSYKREEDYSAIDRQIADGTKPLKKGESKFQDELKKHEHEYIVYKKFRVYCATWNVNGQACNDIDLRSWLALSSEPPDIYAVAFQELDLSPKAITFNETRPDQNWIRAIMRSLHRGAEYEELVSVRLVGMMLSIIVRKELRPNVTRCWTQTVGTGALNFMGNKGGVGVSMTLNEADLCFINSHLAAHVSEVERRNEDFAEIIRRMQFTDTFTRYTIDRHDHIFWIGDLNYRINEIPGLCLDFNNYKELYKFDQLRREMAEYRVFNGYTEGEINFRPSYKYDPGTDNWDSSEKNRAPAWCDRILWRGERIEQFCYDSIMEIRLSDHKPVYSELFTGIKTKDEQKYKRVHEEVLKRVDKYENDNQPQITVEKTDIDFDIINFNEVCIRDFTVANNCHLPVKFSFKIKNEQDRRICEDWLEVEPKSGELITGTSLSIRIKIFIDSHNVWRLHKKQKLYHGKIPLDILVLDVRDGRDIFITIMGEFKPSCFGLNLDTLCRTTCSVSELDYMQLAEIERVNNSLVIPMPREIVLLVDYLFKNGLKTPGLFSFERTQYENPDINEIRDWLDCWSTKDFPGNPYTAAESLLMLLESAPEPLIHPFEDKVLKTETFEQCCSIVQKLSTPRLNVFLYICLFLREGCHQKIFNNGDIASLFGRILLKGHKRNTSRDEDVRRSLFMLKFLTNDINKFARSHFKLGKNEAAVDLVLEDFH